METTPGLWQISNVQSLEKQPVRKDAPPEGVDSLTFPGHNFV
jgi:hypothetical protein